MGDIRHELQSSVEPSKRHANYGDMLLHLHIKGFRSHLDSLLNIESPVTAICGVNGTGKSTVLQLAASAYQSPTGSRYYISTFILAGSLDSKPFVDDASVEFTYADEPSSDGRHPTKKNTVSRTDASWSGYDRQPSRTVLYLGSGFYLPHAERDPHFKELFADTSFRSRERIPLDSNITAKVSRILLCKYEGAHRNLMRKRYARNTTTFVTARREGGVEYSEANMGSGEARLYALVRQLEAIQEKSLVLIEEPETALHPSAQYELGRWLIEVSMRRKLQIILTTHSEYLLVALPQKSRIFLKREGSRVVPISGIGVRQAVSMMDSLAVPAIHILVEDDVAEAIVTELLRRHDPDFLKTARIIIAGDEERIRQMMDVFKDQKIAICAIRDGDCPDNPKMGMFKLFGGGPPEREIFTSQVFRKQFAEQHGVDWDAADIANGEKITNKGKANHHLWFDVLQVQTARKRADLLSLAARAYLDGVEVSEQQSLIGQIKASVP